MAGFCHLPTHKDLPKSMIKIFCQGGESLWRMIEPRTLDVTNAAELMKLQRLHNKLRKVVGKLCRAKGLEVAPIACEEKLEQGPIRLTRPLERIN